MDFEVGTEHERYGSYVIHTALATDSRQPAGFFISGPCLPAVDRSHPMSLDSARAVASKVLSNRSSTWATYASLATGFR